MEYWSDAKASRKVNTPLFRKLDNITKDTYEVESFKKSIKLNLPIQVHFVVYQYVKLRMLQFYYDFLDRYLDCVNFQMCEMDTDSTYITITGNSVEPLVKPELIAEFEQDKCNWFSRTDAPEREAYDKRTPGLFKVEWEDQGIVGLCSKTYSRFGAKDKFSCKGVNKKCNDIKKREIFSCVTHEKEWSWCQSWFVCCEQHHVYWYTSALYVFISFGRWGQYPASGYLNFVCKC